MPPTPCTPTRATCAHRFARHRPRTMEWLGAGVACMLLLALGSAPAQAALAYNSNGVAISGMTLTSTGSTAKATFTVNTNRTRYFPKIVLKVRDSAGRNYDFVQRNGFTISPSRTFSGSRTGLPDGTYKVRVAYSLNGSTWENTAPEETVTVGPHNMDGIGIKNIDTSVFGSTVTTKYTIDTVRPVSFAPITVATRDASGNNLDFGNRSQTVNGQQSFTASRTLSPGTYRPRVVYTLDGTRWVNLSTEKSFTIPSAEASPSPDPAPLPSGNPEPPPGGPWTVAFSDEFNDTAFDTTKWDYKYPRSGDMAYSNWNNGEAQWYKRENITEGGGYLSLTAKRESTTSPSSGRTFDHSSGLIQSKPSFNFQHGYMEARMKLPKGSGFWPAFWTWSSNEQWPPEIDAMEFYGDNTSLLDQTYHGPDGSDGSRISNADWTADWHTFAVDWEPGRLTWYVDGVATKTLSEAPALKMYLIANLAVANGTRAPAPNSSTPLPSSMKIDYIRAWKR